MKMVQQSKHILYSYHFSLELINTWKSPSKYNFTHSKGPLFHMAYATWSIQISLTTSLWVPPTSPWPSLHTFPNRGRAPPPNRFQVFLYVFLFKLKQLTRFSSPRHAVGPTNMGHVIHLSAKVLVHKVRSNWTGVLGHVWAVG